MKYYYQMRNFTSTVLVFFLAACGGGSGGGTATSTPSPPPPAADADPGGLWNGSLTNEDMTVDELEGVSTSDGRFTFVSADTFGPDTFAQYIGVATVDGSIVSGSGRAYAQPGFTWSDGSSILDFTVTAEIAERTRITGSVENGIGETVTFDLDYDAEYERDSSLNLTEGVWFAYDSMRNPITSFTIEADGSFSAQSTIGCQSLGQVSLIDTAFNVYDWSVTISSCGIAGDYAGLAVVGDIDTGDPSNSQNNFVTVSMSNDQRAILLQLER